MTDPAPPVEPPPDPPLAPPATTAPARPHPVRRALAGIGVLGLVLAGASASIFGYALANGIHCPDCSRLVLGDAYGAWRTGFVIKEGAALIALPLGLIGAFGKPRRYGVVACLLAAVLVVFRPM